MNIVTKFQIQIKGCVFLLLKKHFALPLWINDNIMQGEVDTYRELETTSRSFLPQLSLFLDQLSVKKLEAVCCEQLPSVLVVQLLPPLPAGVIVYSINQLVEYFQVVKIISCGEHLYNRPLLRLRSCDRTYRIAGKMSTIPPFLKERMSTVKQSNLKYQVLTQKMSTYPLIVQII